MNRNLRHSITEDDIRSYEQDGVVCIRDQFDQQWLDHMLSVCESHIASPSGTARRSPNSKNDPGQVIMGSHMSRDDARYMDFVLHSPAAEIAARLMRLDEVRFFYDQLFIKEPGTLAPTAWHHDLPFWPFDGNHIASVWVALTPVTRAHSGLVYVAGSHRSGQMYRPEPAVPIDNFLREETAGLPICPPFHHEFSNPAHRFLSWDMAAGDVLVHHPLAVHGAGGNGSNSQRRVALSVRFFGGDATWHGARTGFTVPGTEGGQGLVPGEAPTLDAVFPVCWRSTDNNARSA